MHGLFSFFLLQILLKKSIILFRLVFSRSLFVHDFVRVHIKKWRYEMTESNKNSNTNGNIIKEAFFKWLGLFLVLVGAGLFYLFINNIGYILNGLVYVLSLIKPVIYGAVIAYILNPLVKTFYGAFARIYTKKRKMTEKSEKIFSSIAIVFALLTGILIIVILCWMIIPQIINTMISLINVLPEQADHYYRLITERIQNNKNLASTIQQAVLQATSFLDSKMQTEIIPWLRKELLPNLNEYAIHFASGVMAVVNVLYNLFIGIIVAIYILMSKRTFAAQAKKIVYGIFKKKQADIIIHYTRISNDMFSGFISGKIVDSTIIGVICFAVMSVMNLPYAMLVSVIVGVTNIIPVFGPYIGAIPSTLLILLVSPVQAVYFLILIVVLQQIDGNIIGPAILGESTGLSAFWVLFSILLFGGIWGIVGMLIGCPLFAVIYRIVKDFIAFCLRKRRLNEDTMAYMDLKEIDVEEDSVQYVKYSEDELIGCKEKEEKKENNLSRAIKKAADKITDKKENKKAEK